MSGLSHAISAPVMVELGEHQLLLDAITIKDFTAVIQYMRSQLPDNVAEAARLAADLPPDTAKLLIREAMEDNRRAQSISLEKAMDYALSNIDGLSFLLWLSAEKKSPGKYTHDDVFKIVTNMDADQVQSVAHKLLMASGMDKLGNLIAVNQAAIENLESDQQTGSTSSTPCVSPQNSEGEVSVPVT